MLCFRIIPDSFQSTFQIIPKSFMQLIRNTRVVPCNFPDIPDGKVMINKPHSPSPACLQKFPVGQTPYFARVHFSRSPVNFLVADPVVRFIQAIQNEGSRKEITAMPSFPLRWIRMILGLLIPATVRAYADGSQFHSPSVIQRDNPSFCKRKELPFIGDLDSLREVVLGFSPCLEAAGAGHECRLFLKESLDLRL